MKVRRFAGVSARERDLVVRLTKRCLRELCKKEHELPTSFTEACEALTLTVKARGERSSGCRRGITIDVSAYRSGARTLLEYPAFASDRVIGSRVDAEPIAVLWGTVAHEVSHFVQYRYGPDTRWLTKTYRRAHGEGFRDIYRILRARVVNPFLESGSSDGVSVGLSASAMAS